MFCRSLNLSARWKHRSKLVLCVLVLCCFSLQATKQTSFLLQDASGKTISSRAVDQLLIPASNLKLLSLATVLHFLEPNLTLKTEVRFNGTELLIVGAGDPAISSRYDKDAYTFFRKILRALQSKQVTHLKTLSADVSLFTGPAKPTSWLPEDEPFYYAADLSPLSFEDNCVKFTCQNNQGKIQSQFSPYITVIDQQKPVVAGDVVEDYHQHGNVFTISSAIPMGKSETEYLSIENPAKYTLFELKRFLKIHGITVGNLKVYQKTKESKSYNLLLTHQSPPILQLVTTAMQRSNNFMTEMLTWTAAATQYKTGSWKHSIKLINRFLATHKLVGFKVDDSCGLSRFNRVSAKAMVELLKVTASIPAYRTTLKEMDVQGQSVQYKTGSMSGIFCMSGYIGNSCFSIMINEPGQSRTQLQQQINSRLNLFCQLTAKGKK